MSYFGSFVFVDIFGECAARLEWSAGRSVAIKLAFLTNCQVRSSRAKLVEKFPPLVGVSFERAPVESLPLSGILTSLCLGFTLSLLFFMDQNISAAMVNAPQNRWVVRRSGCLSGA